MDLDKYVKALSAIDKSGLVLMCEYCGTQTPSANETVICSNCESLTHSTKEMLERRDHILAIVLENINKNLKNMNYDDALLLYDGIVAERKDPSYMYAQSLVYTNYSNHEISLISYDKPGFMEDNTKHRDKAAKLTSTSKKLLAKAISTAQSDIVKGDKSQNLVYTMFLCYMKLGNYRGAKDSIELLSSMGSDHLAQYSSMMLNVALKNYEGAIIDANKLIYQNNSTVNALYYVGFSSFKKKKAKEAMKILSSIGKYMNSGNITLLMNEIAEQSSI